MQHLLGVVSLKAFAWIQRCVEAEGGDGGSGGLAVGERESLMGIYKCVSVCVCSVCVCVCVFEDIIGDGLKRTCL